MCALSCVGWWRALDVAASRRDIIKGALALPFVAAGCATAPSAASLAAGRGVLDDVLSVDVHAHPALSETYWSTTITEHVSGTAGLKAQHIDALKNVTQMDKLNGESAVVLVSTNGNADLITVPLP